LERSEGGSVSSVFKDGFPDPAILRRFNLALPKEPLLVPKTFLVQDAEIHPYEFCCVETSEADQSPWEANSEFLHSWCQILGEHAVDGQVGLTLKTPGASRQRLQTSDRQLRLDITLPVQDGFSFAQCGIPAEWEVKYTAHGCPPEICCIGWCDIVPWECVVCGNLNTGGERCARCGVNRLRSSESSRRSGTNTRSRL
jgi:hypothetical protein